MSMSKTYLNVSLFALIKVNKLGVELHTVLEFSGLTKGEANDLVKKIKGVSGEGTLGSLVADAQLHGKSFDNPVEEWMERYGKLQTTRRVSVFVTGDNAAVAQIKAKNLYRMLNAMPGYGCEVVGRYVLNQDRGTYSKVA